MSAEQEQLQRRVLSVLVGTQVLGGVGVASGIAVMALLARALSGSDQLAGLGTTFQVLGGALIAVPVARVMAARGRRPGLALGYLVALAGALIVVAAAIIGQFWLMLVGSFLFGGATTSGSQARYAGADLAPPARRGRHLSLVVWATTIGSVAGPNLVGPAERLGTWLSLPPLTGSFTVAMLGFACAAIVVVVALRPDPLLTARALEAAGPGATAVPAPSRAAKGTVRDGWRSIVGHPIALLGLITMAFGHAVMIAVMVMTPLHMDRGGAGLTLIGLVISIHILGMYAFSPVSGYLVDRFGGRSVGAGGALILVLACVLASLTHQGMSGQLTASLFLLGLGWSGTMVAGSTLLVGALPVQDRAAGQGVSDLAMGLCGAGGGALAGVVLEYWGYSVLALGSCVLAVGILAAAALIRRS